MDDQEEIDQPKEKHPAGPRAGATEVLGIFSEAIESLEDDALALLRRTCVQQDDGTSGYGELLAIIDGEFALRAADVRR